MLIKNICLNYFLYSKRSSARLQHHQKNLQLVEISLFIMKITFDPRIKKVQMVKVSVDIPIKFIVKQS